ncbi:MAG: Nitroreductase [Candidatus Nomurabacteria bacterium GW2011_GWE1_32_28]|uniref:Nitroreductase n=1 Tax=Candidatus Nomurabacteria bacterium GW2011_GWF1_31_48 TaxID=1618767 RepID=A0A0F9YH09_9BACT|nr:MAG: Nitroreductase [Candidatus Nomurabacteria bacterium GW2011_GWF2_30_133]KKP28950.1 MAG: Nitroreductase [Candidatus Nomurabacteria bacterium GW2011_GWE2_31_40]KKP30688.1 MAG: Nitroreductase [Candidatus Nomurabacteria bacterium GW2011_GWF1_31_48]KKP35206.1 MAG: Nitroreductase [Candidatus Nomurabacteria bacterium GW2011_GWE1_32_28]HAS80516.1 nitroreductase [Candidatus Nomurabacteria bacterium]
MKTINNRTTKYPINDIFLNRFSPRAMSGEKIIEEEIMTLFEAARWAPSSMNAQPWRFIYAYKNTPNFDKFLSFLVDYNKSWSKNASVLVVVISKKNFDNGTPSKSHSFDTGSAWENLALQATTIGLITHGIGGFDYSLAKNELSIPDDYEIEIIIAVGKPGKIEDLPEALQIREKPSHRKNIEEIISEGKFNF